MQTRKLVPFFLVVFLVLAFIPFHVKADIATFGFEGIGGTELSTFRGYTFVCKFNMPAAGTITKISYYGRAHTDGQTCTMNVGIYDTTIVGDHYPRLLVGTEQLIDDTAAWHDFAVNQVFAAGDWYLGWGCKASSAADLRYYYDAGDAAQLQADITGYMVDPFHPVDAGAARKVSIHADYTPSGQDLTFSCAENLYPSGTMFFGKELSFTSTNTIQPSDVVSMSKAIGGLLTAFLSTNSIYPSATLLFNKELAFWKYDNLFNSATSTMTKAVQLTLFELFEFVKLHASNIMLPGWTALTIEIAVAIGVLALVLAICGISLVVLRRRRD